MKKTSRQTHIPAKKLWLKLPWLLLIPLGFLLPQLAATSPWAVERWFSRGIFPVINGALGRFFGLFPFSVAEWLLYILVVGIPLLIIVQLIRWFLKKIHWSRILNLFLSLAIAAGAMLNFFYLAWGFNYSRPSTAELLGLNVTERPVEQLSTLCFSLAEEAVKLREQVAEDENGVFTLPEGYRHYFKKIPTAFESLGKEYPLLSRHTPVAKGVIAGSKGLSYAGISGIFIPFTAEPNVNIDQTPLLLLSAAAHETAHYLGIAPENGANFVSYLACSHSEDPAIAYSGIMLALIHSGNKLYSVDEDAYRKLYRSYSDGMKRDLSAHSAYWDAFEGPVEETMTKVNDSYLKHNQQESGVQSYGEMVDLLLAYYFG